ncbi:c-type cytochrome [Varunaivibrio sulfuroxidans]|uniref:Cytochrome c2 n=1 Tax=Varunaivibrio sulfuroxidans TaxID=1773489 RepID=A0A4R3JGH1_9PROT|nr:cytochrome c family protein [Varunaivibrio sulfuroxidans]TCS65034.1 cytochrome c2 [Varunaivibrio sulfuroxidans]WES29677.1 cytochrome c family protein [Varunaivibrio sulfuroxidans]
MKIMTNVVAALALTALVFVLANFFGDIAIPPQGPVVGVSTVEKTSTPPTDKPAVDKPAAEKTPTVDTASEAASQPSTPPASTPPASATPPTQAGSTPALGATALVAGDPVRGKKIFRKCIGCHSFAKGDRVRTGPNLWGIVGRKKASAEGFKYSLAFKALTGVWTPEDIDALITNPRVFASGTKMTFAGLKNSQDRADVIAFLSTLKD